MKQVKHPDNDVIEIWIYYFSCCFWTRLMLNNKTFHQKMSKQTFRRLIEISLLNPDLGAQRPVPLGQEDVHISKSSFYSIIGHNDIHTREKQLAKLNKQPLLALPAPPAFALLPPYVEQDRKYFSAPEKRRQDLAINPYRSANKNRAIQNSKRDFLYFRNTKNPGRITESFITLLNLFLLLLLAFIGYQTVEKILGAHLESVSVEPLTAKDNTRIRNKSLSSHTALSDYKAIWERNLFNISPKKLSVPQKQIDYANVAEADKNTGLKLLGTVAANVSANRFAIIENNQGQNIYHEGDTTGSYVIKKILRNNVIIATENGDKLLSLKPDGFDRGEVALASSQPPSEASKPKRSGVRFKTVELPREEIIAAFDDIDQLIREVGTSSYKFGKLTGFKIGSVSDESILKKIGLRSHDTILALNDKSIEDESEAFEFFERIAEGEKVTIKFRRRNRTRQIELNTI